MLPDPQLNPGWGGGRGWWPAARLVLALALPSLFGIGAAQAVTRPDEMVFLLVAGPDEAAADIERRVEQARGALTAEGHEPVSSEGLEQLLRDVEWSSPGVNTSPDEVERLLEPLVAATARFFASDFDAALELYEAGMAGVLDRQERLHADADAGRAIVDHGLRYVRLLRSLGREQEADGLMGALVHRVHLAEPPATAQHPPRLVEEFVRREEAARARGQTLEARVLPFFDSEGACALFVNGFETGLSVALAPGDHIVEGRCGASLSRSRRVRVSASEAPARAPVQVVIAPEFERALTFESDVGLVLRVPALPEGGAQTAAAVLHATLGVSAVAVSYLGDDGARLFVSEDEPRGVVSRTLVAEALPPRPRLWSYVVLGAGAAFLGAGGYYHWVAVDATRRINSGEQVMGKRQTGEVLMWSFYGAGAGLLIGGALLFVFEPSIGRGERFVEIATRRGPVFEILPSPGGLTLSGRF
jgi:hypothetical protein